MTTGRLGIVIEKDAAVTLGEEARAAIFKEQLAALDEASARMSAVAGDLSRDGLERLGLALDAARSAVSALWHVAEPVEDCQSTTAKG